LTQDTADLLFLTSEASKGYTQMKNAIIKCDIWMTLSKFVKD